MGGAFSIEEIRTEVLANLGTLSTTAAGAKAPRFRPRPLPNHEIEVI